MAEKKSAIWNFFNISEDKTQSICKLCEKHLSYSGGSMSAMRNHLKLVHKRTSFDQTDKPTSSQTTLSNFKMKKMLPIKSEIVNRNLAMMCALDLRPLNIVSGAGFRLFVNSLNPEYQIPCRATVSRYLHKMYDEVKEPIIETLRGSIVSLTTDIWTSLATEGFICLTAHYLTKNWQLENKLLATRIMDERHTGVNITKMITELTTEFGINEIAAIVTDNAANMEKAAKESGFTHIGCFAHTLQLAINEGLKLQSISRATGAARKVVGHFNHSVLATEALKKYQVSQNPSKSPLNIVQDVQTRWNSSYLMMRRLLELRVPVYGVLHDENVIKASERVKFDIQDSHWKIMEELVPVLEPLADATEILASEQLPTSSSVTVLINQLLKNELSENDIDSKVISEFKSIVRQGLEKRYGFARELPNQESLNSPLMLATALDPRYKSLRFLPDEHRNTVIQNIENFIENSGRDETPVNSTLSESVIRVKVEPESPPRKKKSVVEYIQGDVVDLTSCSLDNELKSFIDEKVCEPNPLVWWQQNEMKYPKVAKLARKFLSIPATVVPSERTFSAAGRTVTKSRASLDPENIDVILFLNKNLQRPKDSQISEERPISGTVKPRTIVTVKRENSTSDANPPLPSLPSMD